MNSRHLSKSGERFTPPYLVEAARRVLGGIDLDPASCAKANTVIKADQYFTRDDNALTQNWRGKVFLNPPGTCKIGDDFPGCGRVLLSGKLRKNCGCNYVKHFWNKLLDDVHNETVLACIWVGFSCSQLQSLQQQEVDCPLDFFTCFFKKRVAYLNENLDVLTAPPHNSYVSLVVLRTANTKELEKRFIHEFAQFGVITDRV